MTEKSPILAMLSGDTGKQHRRTISRDFDDEMQSNNEPHGIAAELEKRQQLLTGWDVGNTQDSMDWDRSNSSSDSKLEFLAPEF